MDFNEQLKGIYRAQADYCVFAFMFNDLAQLSLDTEIYWFS